MGFSLGGWLEIILVVGLMISANVYRERVGPMEKRAILENGLPGYITMFNQKGACPLHCGANHYHYTHRTSWRCESDSLCNHHKYIKIIKETKKPQK
tara:strand:- start:125 stop:415 length:291 start_codon:yes stop_codon:yes gene_type:complete